MNKAETRPHLFSGLTKLLQSMRRNCRDLFSGETLWQDIRFAWRMLWKDPGFTLVAALTLGLGIGANASIFSFLKPLLHYVLPYAEPDRLVRIYRTSPQSQIWPHSRADFHDQRELNHVFSALAAYIYEGFNFSATGQSPLRVTAACVTADFFPILGVQPALGRLFAKEEMEPGRNHVVVLSHGFWKSHFGCDSNLIGSTLRFDGETLNIIGILPASFDYPMLWGNPEVWRPFTITAEERTDRENRFLGIIGRLKPGVSLKEAGADMTLLAGRLARDYPQYDGGAGLRVMSLEQSIQAENNNRGWWFLMALSSFVLLIACANLANLQLARATRRLREFAIRSAFGATRSRLMRQLLTESLLISLLGGALGIIFACWCDAFIANSMETGVKIALDFNVVLFALACCVLTTIGFGAVPAWLAVRADLISKLKETVRGTTSAATHLRLQHFLIAGEIASVLILLACAGNSILLLRRFARVDPGWKPEGLLIANASVSKSKHTSAEDRLAFFQQMEDRASVLPGVEAASFTSDIPIQRYWNNQPLRIEGDTPRIRKDMPLASCPTVGPGFFKALGIHLLAGRHFTSDDKLNHPPVVIVNESLARRFWQDQSPLGKKISIGDPALPQWREIVGVVADVHFPMDIERPETRFHVYRPWAQDDISLGGMLVLKTADKPESALPALRHALAELDPEMPLYSPRTARHTIDMVMHGNYRVISLLAIFGGLGLVLAVVGIYGVASYSVARRTVEFGIRMALGARLSDVLQLVLRQGLRLAVLGVLIGIAGAYAILRIQIALIPAGSQALDPMTLMGVPTSGLLMTLAIALLMLPVTLLACCGPARRAARVNPALALRSE